MESMADRPDLGPRKSAVLRAVVEAYVRSGEPVGSETIADHAGLGVSSAAISFRIVADATGTNPGAVALPASGPAMQSLRSGRG